MLNQILVLLNTYLKTYWPFVYLHYYHLVLFIVFGSFSNFKNSIMLKLAFMFKMFRITNLENICSSEHYMHNFDLEKKTKKRTNSAGKSPRKIFTTKLLFYLSFVIGLTITFIGLNSIKVKM